MAKKVKLGERYRDTVTGFEGIATGRYEFLNGCVRYTLETLSDGKPEDAVFDEERLVEAASGKEPKPTSRSGGPRPTPARTGLR